MFHVVGVVNARGGWHWTVTPLLAHGQESGCRTTHCNLEVLQDTTLVFLATKPHILPGVLQEIRPAVGPHHIVVSMAAGVSLQTLQRVSFLLFLHSLSPALSPAPGPASSPFSSSSLSSSFPTLSSLTSFCSFSSHLHLWRKTHCCSAFPT